MFCLLLAMCFDAKIGEDALEEIDQALISITSFPIIFSFLPSVTRRVLRRRWEANVRRRQELFCLSFMPHMGRTVTPPMLGATRSRSTSSEGVRPGPPLTDTEVTPCSDTTVSLIKWVMEELVIHPDILAKVRAEVRNTPLVELDNGEYIKAVVLKGMHSRCTQENFKALVWGGGHMPPASPLAPPLSCKACEAFFTHRPLGQIGLAWLFSFTSVLV